MRNTIRAVWLATLFLAAGCGSSSEEAAAEQAQPKKSVDTGESKWLEAPQESLKGDVVTYEIENQIATRAKFEILFMKLEVPRQFLKQNTGHIERDCAPVGDKKGKPKADKECKEEIPTLDTYHEAIDKQTGQKYTYRTQRARYPDQNILRHFLNKKN